jgi:hypothetical protein
MASELAELMRGEADKVAEFSDVVKVSCTIESSSSGVGESFNLGTTPGLDDTRPLPLPSEALLPLDSNEDGVVIVNVGAVVDDDDDGGEANEKEEEVEVEVEVVGVELSERRREIADAIKPPFDEEGSEP